MRVDAVTACALAASARVARLATVAPGGAPQVVPVCFAIAGGRAYTAVDHKPKRTERLARLRNITAEPRVALLFDRWSEDWSQLWWARLDGRAREVADPAERDAALGALVGRYRQYADRPPQGAVIAVDPLRWSGWRAGPVRP